MLFDINSPILRVFITEMLSYDHKVYVTYTPCNIVLVNNLKKPKYPSIGKQFNIMQ